MTMLRMGSNSSDTRLPEVTVTPAFSVDLQRPQPEPHPPPPQPPPPVPPQPEEVPNIFPWRPQAPGASTFRKPEPSLVEAVNLVGRAVSARIAYHQGEIDALRQALAPFGTMAAADQRTALAGGDQKAVDALLAIARDLTKDPLGAP